MLDFISGTQKNIDHNIKQDTEYNRKNTTC